MRLATGIGSGLVGVCYVLDEPSIGLHPRDNQRLIDALRDLQSLGNTVLVVEHDDAMMRQADHLVDMGPGAGPHGGRIVSQGPPAAVCADPNSITGRYLSGAQSIPVPRERRKIAKTRSITLEGVTTNNLQNVDARFPLGVFTCITGVSGSGKSSLVNETLARALVRRLNGAGPKPGPHNSLRGVNQIDKIVVIDQSPIGRSPRSNPATYMGIFDEVRKVFAGTREAQATRLQIGPLQLQRQRRPLRGMPGARREENRNEVPARPVRHLPGVRRQAVQSADAGGALQGTIDRRRAGSANRRCRGGVREFPAHRAARSRACKRLGSAI